MDEQTKEQEVNDQKELLKAQAKMIKKGENQLATIQDNAVLASMYADNAKVGADNLASELPLLKVHAQGRSTKNELTDGSEPKDGNFFYKPTTEQFEKIECHILTISKGFRAPGMEGEKLVFNQIVGGVILDKGDYKPFIMYMTGLKLSHLWEFGKAAHKYTHAKPLPIPMFAMTVVMTTEQVKTEFGRSWIVKFEIKKNEQGVPELVMDAGEFQFLKDNVETVEDTIASLIDSKTSKDAVEERPQRADVVEGESAAGEGHSGKMPF